MNEMTSESAPDTHPPSAYTSLTALMTFEQVSQRGSVTASNGAQSLVSYPYENSSNQYSVNASSPSAEFSSANGGFTGTGMFAAGPAEDAGDGAGLDEAGADADAEAADTDGSGVGDAEGSAPPWHPVSTIAATTGPARAGTRRRP